MKGSKIAKNFTEREIDRIVEMAWEDRTPFDAIKDQFGISEAETIALMRHQMKASSWRMWRTRVQGRSTKHRALRGFEVGRHKCSRQRHISHNKISKR
ncbi:MAG: TIGR03643 family protein [Cryomorphaceae bacterium]